MKITNLQLVNANNIFTSVADKRLPQKISFAVMKNMTGLQNDFKCYSDSLNKIFKAYIKM